MTDADRALLNGIVALVVATAVAYLVGRDRRMALAAGLLSGSLTALSSWVAATADSRAEPTG